MLCFAVTSSPFSIPEKSTTLASFCVYKDLELPCFVTMPKQVSQRSMNLPIPHRPSSRGCCCMAEVRRHGNGGTRMNRHQKAVESLTRDIQSKISEIEEERMRDGSSWKHIVDKGLQDIQDVAARTGVSPRAQAPLSAYSDVWTFPVCLVTYSTLLITWGSVLAGMLTLVCRGLGCLPANL